MNRINPLHIGALLIAILLFSMFKLSSVTSELKEVKLDYKRDRDSCNKTKWTKICLC